MLSLTADGRPVRVRPGAPNRLTPCV